MSQQLQATSDYPAPHAGLERYRRYQPSGLEHPESIPEGWDVRRLKYAADVDPNSLSSDTSPDFEFYYVDIDSVDSRGRIRFTDEPIRFENAPSRARRVVRKDDVLFGTVRPYLRAIARYRGEPEPCIASTGFAILKSNAGVSSKYLWRYLQSEPFVQESVSRATGIGYPAITSSQLAETPVLVPPEPQQKAIARFLAQATEKIDRLIDKKERLIELLEERQTALITKAVTKGLDPDVPMEDSGVEWVGKIPEHWEVTQLKRVTECLDSRRIPLNAEERSRRQGPYPYWGANGVVDHLDDFLFDEPLALLGEDGAPFFEAHKDVAFSVEGKIWVNNHIHVLRPRSDAIEQEFLTHLLNCVSYGSFIGGSTRDKLTQTEMGRIPVQLPPLDEQKEIVRHLQPELTRMQRVSGRVNDAIRRLKEYRSTLITAAVTGKIDVRDHAA